MAMTKQHRGMNSMRMSYHIDQKCMKPMGGNPPENYEECMQARLCRPMTAGPPDNRPGNSKCMKGTGFEICLFFFVEQLSGDSLRTHQT